MQHAKIHAPRRLGLSDTHLVPLALGCFSMSHAYGHRSEAESVQVIQRALDTGMRFIDTADYYGWGHNETLIARAIQGRRSDAVLSSKVGYRRADEGYVVCGRPAYIRQACEASLDRLQTDSLDVLFLHRRDPDVPLEETVGAMADLVHSGKVRHIGLCEVSPQALRRAYAVHPIAALQAEYSLWTRDVEGDVEAACKELGVTLMPFSPLGRGMLTGRIRSLDDLEPGDVRRKQPRFSPENLAWNVGLVDRLHATAQELSCSLAQLALSWILHKNPTAIPICGCDTLKFLADNQGALAVELSAKNLQMISELFSPDQVAGDRYDARVMAILAQSRE